MTNGLRRYYPGITIFKLIGSLLVMQNHIRLSDTYMELNQHLPGLVQAASMVVPCFYMIAGFLAYQGWHHAREPRRYVTTYLRWVGLVYVFFCLLHFGTVVVPQLVASNFSVQPLKVLFERYLVRGPYLVLWFIPPLLFGIFVSYALDSRQQLRKGVWLALAGFVLAQVLNGSLRVVVEAWFPAVIPLFQIKHMYLLGYAAANYLGVGFPFILGGVLVAKYEDVFLQIRARTFVALTGLCVGTEFLLLHWLVEGPLQYQLAVSMLPISVFLFYGVLHIQSAGIRKYHKLINTYSMVVYFTHMFLIALNAWLLGWSTGHLSPLQAAVCAGLTFLQTVLLTALFMVFTQKKLQPAGFEELGRMQAPQGKPVPGALPIREG
ncbi:acyltransferase family protein [Hymenobacter sp. J193]|uniref:acyltransferase family protein n=1 Tax=Hymenobacter sp. J193 TaxID=2898429 RepID=UPI0035AE7959